MKEATGELSVTAITVVAVAAISAIVMTFILPGLKNTITKRSACAQAYSCTPNGDGTSKCYWDEQQSDGTFKKTEVTCDTK